MYKCWSYDQLGASMRPCKKASWDRSSMLDWRKGDKLIRAELSGLPGGTITVLLGGWKELKEEARVL